jgi:hypothetical protein
MVVVVVVVRSGGEVERKNEQRDAQGQSVRQSVNEESGLSVRQGQTVIARKVPIPERASELRTGVLGPQLKRLADTARMKGGGI